MSKIKSAKIERKTWSIERPLGLAVGYGPHKLFQNKYHCTKYPAIIGFYNCPEELLIAATAIPSEIAEKTGYRDEDGDEWWNHYQINRILAISPFKNSIKEWETRITTYAVNYELGIGDSIAFDSFHARETLPEFKKFLENRVKEVIEKSDDKTRDKEVLKLLDSTYIYYDIKPLWEQKNQKMAKDITETFFKK